MKTFKYACVAVSLGLGLSVASCYDLDLEPHGILGEDVMLISDNGVKKYLAVAYQDLPIEDFNYKQNGDEKGYASVNQAGWHGGNRWQAQKGSPASAAQEASGRDPSYGGGWGYWAYDRIRDVNNLIEKMPNYRDNYKEDEYNAILGEAHFLRAYFYFGMVKRYGGVPIVKQVLDPKGNLADLQQPRDKEYDCWKFIHDDLQFAMENAAPRSKYEPGRANRYAAAALMSRAMLYAGSIAKYGGYIGTTGPAVSAGLMGIPEDKAQEFFQYAYDACKFIKDGGYKLHTGSDKEKAFTEVFIGDRRDDEDIFVKQYTEMKDAIWDTNLFHCWDTMVLPLGTNLANQVGCALQPTWELIKMYEMPAIVDADGRPIRFDSMEDIWNNDVMEPRARATFFFSGMVEPVSGQKLDQQAGVYKAFPGLAVDGQEEVSKSENDYTKQYRINAERPENSVSAGGGPIQLIDGEEVKVAGPYGVYRGTGDEGYGRMGAFIRKYVDFTAQPSTRKFFGSTQSWKVFRYGEVLCNWAEAAYELGLITGSESLKQEAIDYVNELRDRAGAHPYQLVANPEDVGSDVYGFAIDENLQFIRDERARELAFENQRLFDLRRWRVADIMFQDGKFSHTLSPYFVVNENKWIYLNEVESEGRKVTFDKQWYYEQIPGGEIGKNPNLIRNDGY